MKSSFKKIFIITVFIIFAAFLCFLSGCSDSGIKQTASPSAPQTVTEVAAPTASSTFNVKSFESFKAISGYSHCKKVIIDGDITLTENVVFEHPVDVTVNGAIRADGYSVIIKSYETDAVNINVSNGSSVSEGAVTVDCPYSHLSWTGGCIPTVDFVLENMNVNSFNGNDLSGRLTGGAGSSVFKDAALKDSGGSVISGTEVLTDGNVITLLYPFALNESVLKGASLDISAENCIEWSLTDREKKQATSLSLGGKYAVTLTDEDGRTRGYYLNIRRKCESLPVVSVYTDGGASIDSKEVYTKGSLSIDCSGSDTYRNFSFEGKSLGIKGRGNASWNYTDKKSYRLKFGEKVSVLGMSPDKDWVLVSNYFDKSLIRNVVAHELAKQMENLEYTPTHVPVDLFINGEYRGVYTIADKIEVSDEKIDIETSFSVENPGFLIEIGWDYSSENIYGKDYFDVEIIKRLYVKDPEITEKYNSRICDIIDYVRLADKAISTGEGYEEYIDVDSMVDWFIIAELTNNTEMAFYRSCYFYKPEGGKIKMGPVWDFDMAFGNHRGDISNYNGWATAEAEYAYVNDTWTTYLIKDEAFMEKVRARWNEKKDILLKTATATIDKVSSDISASQAENFKKWDILNTQIGEGNVDYRVYNTYEKQVEYIREFVTNRAEWITDRLNVK